MIPYGIHVFISWDVTNVSPGIQVCESQSKHRVSIAQWVERWHGTPEALGSSPG